MLIIHLKKSYILKHPKSIILKPMQPFCRCLLIFKMKEKRTAFVALISISTGFVIVKYEKDQVS